jgi:hypothetical protein
MATSTTTKRTPKLSPEAARQKSFNEAVALIRKKEPEMAQAIEEMVIHVGGTYGDKYANSPIETKGLIYWADDKAKGYNIGQAARYIQRYLTDGFKKSDNPTDIKKCLHYILFELTRLIKLDKVKVKSKDIIE